MLYDSPFNFLKFTFENKKFYKTKAFSHISTTPKYYWKQILMI